MTGQDAHDRAAPAAGGLVRLWRNRAWVPAHRRPTCSPIRRRGARRAAASLGTADRPSAHRPARVRRRLRFRLGLRRRSGATRLGLGRQRRDRVRSPPCAGAGAPRARGARARAPPRSATRCWASVLAAEQAHVRCRGQLVLEQHRGGARVLGPAAAARGRDRRGEALVVQIDGHSHPTTQPLGKITRCHRLFGIGAAQADRQPDDDLARSRARARGRRCGPSRAWCPGARSRSIGVASVPVGIAHGASAACAAVVQRQHAH